MRFAFVLGIALLVACATRSTPGGGAPRVQGADRSPASQPIASDVPATAVAPAPAPGGIQRTLIDRRPATGLTGWETRLYLIEYAPGAAAPVHVHPAVGIGLVLEGRFESAFGDGPVAQVQAGQGFVDQAGVTHRVFRNPSPDQRLRFVVAYTLQTGEEPFRLGPAAAPSAPSR